MLNIGVDMDGVIANWHDAAVKKINELWDLNIEALYTTYTGNIIQEKLLEKGIQLSVKEIYSQLCPVSFFRTLEPIGDVYQAVKNLSKYANIFIVTKPIEWSYVPQEKIDWLKEHLRDIPYKVVMTEDSEVKGLLKLDMMIDDDPRTADSFKDKGVTVFMPRCTWNKEYLDNTFYYDLIPVEHISNVVEVIESYIKGKKNI